MTHPKMLLLAIATLPMAASASGNTLDCLRARIGVQAIGFDQSVIDSRAVQVEVSNGMGTALGGVWIDFAIHSDQRRSPIYTGSIRPAATIEGLLEPGERMLATDFHFMDDRALQFARDANELTITLNVQNAADPQMNGFIAYPRMANWSGETTDQRCDLP